MALHETLISLIEIIIPDQDRSVMALCVRERCIEQFGLKVVSTIGGDATLLVDEKSVKEAICGAIEIIRFN